MSAKYSNSPALHLRLASSGLRRRLLLLLTSAACCALYLLWQQGYSWLASIILPLVVWLTWAQWRDRLQDAVLCWDRGEWSLQYLQQKQVIEVLPGSTCLPWVIYLAGRDVSSGRRWQSWIFSDCADRENLRRLRVRLILGG